MFQAHWGVKEDARSATYRIVALTMTSVPWSVLLPIAVPLMIRRMVPRMAFAGANPKNARYPHRSAIRTVELLEAHLAERGDLLDGRPAFGDLGIRGNLDQA